MKSKCRAVLSANTTQHDNTEAKYLRKLKEENWCVAECCKLGQAGKGAWVYIYYDLLPKQ